MADLPLTISMAALPPNMAFTPQNLADAIAARLTIETQQTFALFVSGSTEPSSNVGPWLKDGTEWWVWSTVTADYVPITIPQESLKFVVQEAAPDPTVYQMWIQTTALGSPLALKTYYSGAWVDVYATKFAGYSTTVEMNAAIAAAISAIPPVTIVAGQGSFSAKPAVTQSVVFAAPGNQTGTVTLGTEVFDPDNCFATNTFTVPATGYYFFTASMQVTSSGGSPTDLDITGNIVASSIGYPIGPLNDEPGPDGTNSRTITGSGYAYLTAADTVTLTYNFTTNAAVTVEIFPDATVLSGYRVR